MIVATISGSAVPTTVWLTEYQADHGMMKTRIVQMAISGMMPTQIAAVTGWLPASVSSRLSRARAAGMKSLFVPQGVREPSFLYKDWHPPDGDTR
jgi:hypothetical protein